MGKCKKTLSRKQEYNKYTQKLKKKLIRTYSRLRKDLITKIKQKIIYVFRDECRGIFSICIFIEY